MAITSSISPTQAPQIMGGPTAVQSGSAVASNDTSGGFDSLLGNTLGSVAGTAANIYGAQNASEAQNNGILAGIGTQQQTLGNINNLFSTQANTGNGAFTALGSALGTNGAPPDPSVFTNQPGYQFAVQQGTQAIDRQATAMGSAYTPNTLDAVGQYVTGTASQNYNNYISQLLSTAGLGSTANQALTTANLQVGGNTSQLQQNSGNAQASGQAAIGSQVGGLLGNIFGSGANSSGLGGAIGSGIGNLSNGLNANGTFTPSLTGLNNDTSNYLNQNINTSMDPSQYVSNDQVLNSLGNNSGSSSVPYIDNGDSYGGP